MSYTLWKKKPFRSARLPPDKALYLQLKEKKTWQNPKGNWQSALKASSFYAIQNSCPKLYGTALQFTLVKKRSRGSALMSQRELKAFLPFMATTSFKAQRWTSWPHRVLGKRLRTRASENSRSTANSSALDVNKSSLNTKRKKLFALCCAIHWS